MTKKETISIIGAGAWGTTLSTLLAEKGLPVKLWVYEKELADIIKEYRENKWFLPGFPIPSNIDVTTAQKEAASAGYFIFAIPSVHLRSVAKQFSGHIKKDSVIISATKGLEQESLKRMSEVLNDELENKNICVLSGPNLSREIAKGLPAASVAASKDEKISKAVQKLLMMERFRIYTNTDVVGVELGGTLKNIIALAAGITDGLELGDNAKAGLMVRGMAEITRLGTALGAKAETFTGLSGIGDLVTTCSSKLSRNHQVGERLAKGEKLKKILGDMKDVAEGVPTTKAAKKLSQKHKIEMPILNQVHAVLFEEKDPYKAITDLMTRTPKGEV